ncbi:ASCH domain-containing protein, partial [Enterobacter ludwigii]|uniref:ASCH domain-containing protein n=1 Tax=Enterobacter ludwigii TaxID=299767 RepID=UPI0020762E5A
ADRNRSHWSTSKTPSYTKSVSWQHHRSFTSYQQEEPAPKIGSYNIILDGQSIPVCVIRLVSMRLVRFCDVTEEFARKEGEGDLSLEYWQKEHQRFFTREGYFSKEMELITEEFEVVELL